MGFGDVYKEDPQRGERGRYEIEAWRGRMANRVSFGDSSGNVLDERRGVIVEVRMARVARGESRGKSQSEARTSVVVREESVLGDWSWARGTRHDGGALNLD